MSDRDQDRNLDRNLDRNSSLEHNRNGTALNLSEGQSRLPPPQSPQSDNDSFSTIVTLIQT
ncbi:hypothetical protein [Ferrimonas lipolytica]|uniref:Uncharacterized protein n=1 Tax=Ferrimonas lipolytica TaxID=2724191 RepID=A0A6H1UEW6_9GAMM|nr:hypothetical protein [Ferrimonas lipolytica]QIZ77647.1 hypothetical protein HER31_12535 [Ferrimonas lipolytica]